jgi:hypothetical protein
VKNVSYEVEVCTSLVPFQSTVYEETSRRKAKAIYKQQKKKYIYVKLWKITTVKKKIKP